MRARVYALFLGIAVAVSLPLDATAVDATAACPFFIEGFASIWVDPALDGEARLC